MADTHLDENHPDFLFKRQRKGRTHIDNCGTGGDGGHRGTKMHQVHHALCVHACSDMTFPDDLEEDEVTFIKICLAETDWDINATGNVIGLPLKKAYVRDFKDATGWDGYPCHQVDHDIYLKKVEIYVTDTIWDKVRKSKKKKKCEQLKGEKLVKAFDDGSKSWKDFLMERGKEHGGTKACLYYCVEPPPPRTATKMNDSNWYIPFSMAPDGMRERVKPKANKILRRLGLLVELIR